MKLKKPISLLLGASCGLVALSGCVFKAFEKEINVVFKNEGEIVGSGTITQFKNIQSPTISSAYIPDNYRFLGWTCYSESELDLEDATHFKSQYIGAGRMVHYMDVVSFAKNQTVTCEALIMHKDDIPKDYHYVVLAWYDKAANSGLDQGKMDGYETMIKNYMTSEGLSEEDVNSIVVRGYAGNVGPTTGQILYDDDVDIMFGWGSVNNITTTGSIPEEMIKESVEYPITYGDTVKNRYIHRLSDSEGSLKLMEYLQSEESKSYFNS